LLSLAFTVSRHGPEFERDLPELLHFFALPPHLEVRRRTRPIVVFSNVESVEGIHRCDFQ